MRIEVVTEIDAEPAAVFDLELDVDLHAASLAGTGETAETRSGARQLGPGDDVTFRARHLGVRWRFTARITEYDRPRRFVDEQVRGPFRSFRHEHLFEPIAPGRTRMTDRVTFTAPAGPVGRVVARVVLAPHLVRMLQTRGDHLARIAAGPGRG